MNDAGVDIDPRPLWVSACVGLGVFGVSAVVAADGRVGEAEEAAFRWVNGWPDALGPVMWVFQLAGILVVPLVLAVVAWRCHRPRLAVLLAAIVPIKLFVEHLIVKQLIDRQRPGTTICHLDASCASFRDVPMYGSSFVSGHAVIAWAVATVLWWHLPRAWRWVPVAVAVANSIARVYLGAHNPLDVVGGAGIGVAVGSVLLLVDRAVTRGQVDDERQPAELAVAG